MARFVLVQGSAQSSRGWDRLKPLLERRGHAVTTPQLPLSAPRWDFADYAEAIAAAIATPDTIVVAHSAMGMFLPLVANRAPCRLTVYLAAAVPEPGKSLRDQLAEDASMFSRAWLESGPRWNDPSRFAALADEFLFHDCDDDTRRWAGTTVQVCDVRHLATRPFPAVDRGDAAVASIVPTLDRTLSPEWMRRKSREVLGVEPIEIAAGHCPHVSQPEAIAGILGALAVPGRTDVPDDD